MGWKDAPLTKDLPRWQTAPAIDTPAPDLVPTTGQVARNAAAKAIPNLLDTPLSLASLLAKGVASLPFASHLKPLQDLANEPELQARPAMDAARSVGLVNPAFDPQTGPQRVLDTAIQSGLSTALAPASSVGQFARNVGVGAASGLAGQTTKEITKPIVGETGSTLLALGAGAFTPFAISGLGTNKVRLNSEEKRILAEGQPYGLVVQPSSVKPTGASNKLESVAGGASVRQAASLHNGEKFDQLAAKSVGLPPETVLTPEILDQVRAQAAKPYEEIAALSPRAKTALDGLKQARFNAKENWNYYRRSGNPDAGTQARTWDARAEQYERVIDGEAKRIISVYGVKSTPPGARPGPTGQPFPPSAQLETRAMTETRGGLPSTQGTSASSAAGTTIDTELLGQRTAGTADLMDRLKESRKLIARTYDVEKALIGGGHVAGDVLGGMLRKGKPLTGELKIIGEFANAFPKVSQRMPSVIPPGASGTDAASAAVLATMGDGTGKLAAGLPMLRGPARNLVLSPGYQSRLLKPPVPFGQSVIRSGLAGSPLLQTILQPAPTDN